MPVFDLRIIYTYFAGTHEKNIKEEEKKTDSMGEPCNLDRVALILYKFPMCYNKFL